MMVAPIDYRLDIQSPVEAFLGSAKLGAGLAEAQAAARAKQAELERQQSMQEALSGLYANPNATSEDYARVAGLMPKEVGDNLRASAAVLTEADREKELQFGAQVMSALGSDKPEFGLSLLRERAHGERNRGREDQAKAYETWATIAEQSPAAAKNTIGLLMAQLPGGDKVIESVTKIGAERRAEELQPSALKESESKAEKAAVLARFAESDAVLEQQKKGWDIKKLQSDMRIAQQNANIAAAEVAAKREANATERAKLNLQVEKMIADRDATVRERVAAYEAGAASMDGLISTAREALNTPFSVIKDATGPIGSRLPTLSEDTANFEALVETLSSQSFLSQVEQMRGLGALTQSEGEKLVSGLKNLSLKQGHRQLVKNIQDLVGKMEEARGRLSRKTGVPLSSAPSGKPATDEPIVVDF